MHNAQCPENTRTESMLCLYVMYTAENTDFRFLPFITHRTATGAERVSTKTSLSISSESEHRRSTEVVKPHEIQEP